MKLINQQNNLPNDVVDPPSLAAFESSLNLSLMELEQGGGIWGQGSWTHTKSPQEILGHETRGSHLPLGRGDIHQLRFAHLPPHTSVLTRDGTAEGDNGDNGGFAEPWLRRDGESREKVRKPTEATTNTVEITGVTERFRAEIPL